MNPIFTFTPKEAHSSKILAEDLTDQKDFQAFLRANVGKSITVTLKLTEKIPEKQRMYDYYHKVILGVAIQVYTNDGWESVDKVKADYLLKAECGKGIMYNSKTQEEDIYLEDKSRMNKDRLRKYLTDCITFLQVEKGAVVPDSASYLMEIQTGISGFKSTNDKRD
jgi:hypothetical protein